MFLNEGEVLHLHFVAIYGTLRSESDPPCLRFMRILHTASAEKATLPQYHLLAPIDSIRATPQPYAGPHVWPFLPARGCLQQNAASFAAGIAFGAGRKASVG